MEENATFNQFPNLHVLPVSKLCLCWAQKIISCLECVGVEQEAAFNMVCLLLSSGNAGVNCATVPPTCMPPLLSQQYWAAGFRVLINTKLSSFSHGCEGNKSCMLLSKEWWPGGWDLYTCLHVMCSFKAQYPYSILLCAGRHLANYHRVRNDCRYSLYCSYCSGSRCWMFFDTSISDWTIDINFFTRHW